MATRAQGRLIYDADCGFCTRSARWLAQDGAAFEIVSWQGLPDLGALGLTVEDVTTAAYWQAGDGTLSRGADAIARSLVARGGVFALTGRVLLVPPVRQLAHLVYGRVAVNRHRMPGGTGACRIDQRPAG